MSFTKTPTMILDSEGAKPRLRAAFDLAVNAFQQVCETQGIDHASVYLNKYVLNATIESYFCDIYRLQHFRHITEPDMHKQAAFMIKWIVKFRPVQLNAACREITETLLFVNEVFALHLALTILGINNRRFIEDRPKYFENLLYVLHFHAHFETEQLASELYLLEEQYRFFAA